MGLIMFTKLEEIYMLVEDTVTLLRERFASEIVCKKGCADCCSAVFDVSFVEAANIACHFKKLDSTTQQEILGRAETALQEWRTLFAGQGDPAQARIRCPLLGPDNACVLYQARPINCRTYGVPTVIQGTAHVCGLSRFDKGISYPTIQLEPLQQGLYETSCSLAGPEQGALRFPIAQVLLKPEPFLTQVKPE